jgi:hypothetical protein
MDVATLSVPAQEWARVSRLHIAFGHQSVGNNILTGLVLLKASSDHGITIREGRSPSATPAIVHFKVGHNGDPLGKLADFRAVMDGGVAAQSSVALLKFCYSDFEQDGNSLDLAEAYRKTLADLAVSYPGTRFVAITAPLKTIQTGPKAWIKALLGRRPDGYVENQRLAIFNRQLRAIYSDPDELFDIAAIESRFGQVSFAVDGQNIEALDGSLSEDGAHLNETGERIAAAALIHHLARLSAN